MGKGVAGMLRRGFRGQLAHAGVELHHDVGGIEAALPLQVVGKVGQLAAQPVER